MPIRLLPLSMVNESTTRRVAISVVDELKAITGLDKDIEVVYTGPDTNNAQPGTRLNDTFTNTFENSNRITIVVEETYRDSAVVGSPVHQQEERPIFLDDKIGVSLKPVYSYTDVRISVVYRASSKTRAEQWRNDIKVRLADNRGPQLVNVDYHYPVPAYFLYVLRELHKLREQVAGYNQTFTEYFNLHCSPRITQIQPDEKAGKLLVVKEKQLGNVARFDFEVPPREERNENSSSWQIQFDYLFSYQQPVSSEFIFPIIVHNQIIPDALFDDKPFDLDKQPVFKGFYKESLDKVVRRELPDDPIGGIRIPDYDEWLPYHIPVKTVGLINWLLTMEPADTRTILNLNALGRWVVHPAVIKFLKDEHAYVNRQGQSFVYFHLFMDRHPMTAPSVEMSEDLTLKMTVPANLREQYHLRFSLNVDYARFTERALRSMESHGICTLLFFQSLINDLDVEWAKENAMSNGYLMRWYIEWFFKRLKERMDHEVGGPISGGGGGAGGGINGGYYNDWSLVNYLSIISKRKETST